jgi:hypothetical protein
MKIFSCNLRALRGKQIKFYPYDGNDLCLIIYQYISRQQSRIKSQV